jgi:hypothetical protein
MLFPAALEAQSSGFPFASGPSLQVDVQRVFDRGADPETAVAWYAILLVATAQHSVKAYDRYGQRLLVLTMVIRNKSEGKVFQHQFGTQTICFTRRAGPHGAGDGLNGPRLPGAVPGC